MSNKVETIERIYELAGQDDFESSQSESVQLTAELYKLYEGVISFDALLTVLEVCEGLDPEFVAGRLDVVCETIKAANEVFETIKDRTTKIV